MSDLPPSTTERPVHAEPSPFPPLQKNNHQRKRMLLLLAAVIFIAAVGYALYYFLYAYAYETTDDAYVNGNIVQITAQIAGTVVAVNADDTQSVKEGQSIILLDSTDARIAVDQAKANLAQAVRQVRTLFINNAVYQANVAQRQAELVRAQSDLHRRMKVADTGVMSAEEVEHARAAVQSAQAALDAATQQFAANFALTNRTAIDHHPTVLAAAAKVREAYLNYARTTLPAPVTGIVARRSVQVGQRVAPDTPLMAIVPLEAVWVDANFKEVQLKQIQIGQPVILTADAYGSSVVFHGRIMGFSAGTGSAFSLLPAQNATGNWIKIVQRLPVRIWLDPKELQQHPLRIGLSMQVKADIRHPPKMLRRDHRFNPLSSLHDQTNQTKVFEQDGAQAKAEIQRIIAQNK